MRKLATLLTMITTFGSFAQETSVSGFIRQTNLPKIFLETSIIEESGQRMTRILDSCELKPDGSFILRTDLKQLTLVNLFDGSDYLELLLAPGDQLVLETDKYFFDEAVILKGTGSERNTVIHQLRLIWKGINRTVIASRFNSDTVQVFAVLDDALNSLTKLCESYRKLYPEIRSYLDETIQELNDQPKWYREVIRSNDDYNMRVASLINHPAPELSGFNLKGDPIKLSDFKGKITVINFWTSSNTFCKAEFPKLEEFQELYGKDVNFVSVGVFCYPPDWRKEAIKSKIPNQIFIDKSEEKQLEAYGLTYVPRYVVLDANHKIISSNASLPSSGILQKYWGK